MGRVTPPDGDSTALVEVFSAHRVRSGSPSIEAQANDAYANDAPTAGAVGDVLAALLDAGRAAHPGIVVDGASFAAHLAHVTPAGPVSLEALRTLRAGDLYLAHGCAFGQRAALDAFAAAYGDEIRRAAEKSRLRPEDLQQTTWQKLFVAPTDEGGHARPKIADYGGQGDLRAWVRVVVARVVIDLKRLKSDGEQLAKHGDGRDGWGIPSPADDPELDYLKRLYRHEFAVAFEEALGALTPEARNALRHQFAEKLSIDQIAAIHGIHRATAARRLTQAREALLAETRRRLASKLRLSHGELESVIRMIESQLHVSVARLLA